MLLLGGGAAVEHWCEARDFERYASKETFAAVRGGSVRYRLIGANHASMPVVFLTGMIGSLEQWDLVQNSVGTFAPALAYDRGGSGFSTSSAHDVQQQGDELAALLVAIGLKRPVIIVGYSASGALARAFSVQHRQQVGALVLVDPDLEVRIPNYHGPLRNYARTMGTCTLLSLFGVRRLANQFGFLKFEPAPQTEMDHRALAVLQRFPHWWANDRELFEHEASERQVLAASRIDNLPVSMFVTDGAEEGEIGRAYGRALRNDVAGPQAVLKGLGNVEHSLVLNNQGAVNQIVDGIRALALPAPHN